MIVITPDVFIINFSRPYKARINRRIKSMLSLIKSRCTPPDLEICLSISITRSLTLLSISIFSIYACSSPSWTRIKSQKTVMLSSKVPWSFISSSFCSNKFLKAFTSSMQLSLSFWLRSLKYCFLTISLTLAMRLYAKSCTSASLNSTLVLKWRTKMFFTRNSRRFTEYSKSVSRSKKDPMLTSKFLIWFSRTKANSDRVSSFQTNSGDFSSSTENKRRNLRGSNT